MSETIWHVSVLAVIIVGGLSAVNIAVPDAASTTTTGLSDALSAASPALLGLLLVGAGTVAYSYVGRSF